MIKNFVQNLTLKLSNKILAQLFIFLFFISFAKSQNTSYNANSIPITIGQQNVAIGYQTLSSATSGEWNTSIGYQSMFKSINPLNSTAVGYKSLYNTSSTACNCSNGWSNTAVGYETMFSNTTGSINSAVGFQTLRNNISGTSNNAFGYLTLVDNTLGSWNNAFGSQALFTNTTGNNNTAIGDFSCVNNTTGNYNTALGDRALNNNVSGSNNTALGKGADVGSGSLFNSTAIGNGAIVNTSNAMQLGNSAVTNIYAGTGTTATLIAGGLQITGGVLGAGKVLTSNASGVATWQTPLGGGGGGSNWSLMGNAGTIDGINSLGTTDNNPLNFIVNNQKAARLDPILRNSFYGLLGGTNNATGTNNSTLGYNANFGSSNLTNATAIGSNSIVTTSNSIQFGDANVTTVYAGTGTNAKVIAGGLQITGGSLATDNLLTSDAVGNATWQAPTFWSLNGNAGTVDGSNFIGTTDPVSLSFRVNNLKSGRIDNAKQSTSFGIGADNNVGDYNSAFGYGALNNSTGFGNTAIGHFALKSNTTGGDNTALGIQSLFNNTAGEHNTSIGNLALSFNTIGRYNTAVGLAALGGSTDGNNNVGLGNRAGIGNVSGSMNTSIGDNSSQFNFTGNNNTIVGANSDFSFGIYGLSNTSSLGAFSLINTSDKIRLGDANVTVVEGPTYNTISDGRFKTNISEKDIKGLEFINKLRPVVYNFDTKAFEDFLTKGKPDSIRSKYMDRDFTKSTSIRQSGFIAQEVEAAAKETGYDFNGVHVPETKEDNYSLAYAQFVVPLVKAVQELSIQNETLKRNTEKQNEINETLKKDIEELRTLVSSLKNKTIEGSIKITEDRIEAKLYQNTPNPFTNTTTIRYSIPANAKNAFINITTLNGAKIKSFELNTKNGEKIEISGGQLSAGTYIYSLSVDNILVDSKKMILTK